MQCSGLGAVAFPLAGDCFGRSGGSLDGALAAPASALCGRRHGALLLMLIAPVATCVLSCQPHSIFGGTFGSRLTSAGPWRTLNTRRFLPLHLPQLNHRLVPFPGWWKRGFWEWLSSAAFCWRIPAA